MDLARLISEIIGVAIAVAISFWHKILEWAHETLFPWFQQWLPALGDYVREAFRWFDQYAAVPVRLLIKQAWQSIRQFLLKTVVNFERRYGATKWTRTFLSFLLTNTKEIIKSEVIEAVDWEELPDDVRTEFLRRGTSIKDFNVTEMRDKEIETIQY